MSLMQYGNTKSNITNKSLHEKSNLEKRTTQPEAKFKVWEDSEKVEGENELYGEERKRSRQHHLWKHFGAKKTDWSEQLGQPF